MHYSLSKPLAALLLLSALTGSSVQAVTPDELFEVLQRIESLENEVRYLRGENEQLRYDIEDVKNTQKSTFIRIDDRMDDLFRAVNTATSKMSLPVAPVPSLPVAPVKSKTSKVLPQVRAPEPAAPKPVLAVPVARKLPVAPKKEVVAKPVVKEVPVTIPKSDKAAEQVAYNAALSKVKAQPTVAVTQFRGFLKKYPSSPLAANAQYWLGELMYSRRNFQGAIDEFVIVLQNYGTSPKAPDAAMMMGFSFYELKNWVYARRSLEGVVRKYPKSPVATLAKAKLDKMKADNLY